MKNNILYTIKYIFLVFLICLACIQTAKLWLNTPRYSMLLNFYKTTDKVLENDSNYINIILPSTVGVRADDNFYYIVSNKVKGYEDFLNSCDSIITKGIESNLPDYNIKSINFDFSKPHILIDYPFELDKELFLSMYKLSAYSDFPEYIDYVLIENSSNLNADNMLFIHDARKDLLYAYKLEYNDLFIELEVLNHTIKKEIYDKNIRYELSSDCSYEFSKTFLLPADKEYAILNYSLNPYIPFFDGNDANVEELDAFVKPFANNKMLLQSSLVNENIVYIENNAVLKYSKSGVFEYIEGIEKRGVKKNFFLDFSEGIDFMDRKVDKTLVEYYLNSYEYKEDGLHIYYDLAYNGIKCDFSDECKENGMSYPIEIIVYNGKTVYFKWLLRFMPDIIQQSDKIMLSYSDIINDLNADFSSFEDIKIIYKEKDDILNLTWVIDKGDKKEFKEVVSE